MSPICPPCCGCHGNGPCLATAHCTFSSYGRLEAERVNQFWWNLVHSIKLGPLWQSSHHVPEMSAMMRLPWRWPLPSNGALNIMQSWASARRTREPILMKIGMQQQVRTAMTVMRSNFFKIQNGGRSLLESIRNAITRLQMDRLGCNFGGRIPSCSQYWKCYNSSYDVTDRDDSWVVASEQHLCCKTVSLVFGRYC